MSEINWPIPSFIGEIYTSPLGKTWRWNGYAWDFVGPDYAIGPTGATGSAAVYGEPWGIFDSSGNVTTYPTFASAMAASTLQDTIHMFCNVQETNDVTLDISGTTGAISIDFNGHVYSMNNASGSTPAITVSNKAPGFLYNGIIIREGSNDAPAIYIEDSPLVHLDGLYIFSINSSDSTGTLHIKDSLVMGNKISVDSSAESPVALYTESSSISEKNNVELTNIQIIRGESICNNTTLQGINTINGHLSAKMCKIYDSVFKSSSLGVSAVTVEDCDLYKVQGIKEAGSGNGIDIIIGNTTSEIIDCIGKGLGKASIGISVSQITSP